MATTVGERLAAHRRHRGWTQQDVADRMGLTRVTVSSHERDATAPDGETLMRYATLYGTTAQALAYPPADAPTFEAPPGADRFFVGVLWSCERMSGEITAMLRDARRMADGLDAPPVPAAAPPTDEEREFLALMRKGGEEMRARLEREALEKQTPPRGKQGRRASGA